MKKIMNKADSMVLEMCNGIVMTNPEIECISKYKVLKKKKIDKSKVTLISGGGTGHEPAHAGFIGKGMLDAAVCGEVFASPSQIQVYQAIKETASDEGTLLIIKNYSGDNMNFKNAAYMASEDNIIVDYVIVDDDIAVQDSLYTVGRRGVAGTVLVHKIAGAAAEMGMSLSEVKRYAEETIENVKSLGFAYNSCTVPNKGTPTIEMADDEMEYGVGIHGEPGIKRDKIISADEMAERMIKSLLNELSVTSSDEIVLMINGFGATPLQELYILNNSVSRVLSENNINVYRCFVGEYMTSIDMIGASVSILKLTPKLKELLDKPSLAPGFTVLGKQPKVPYTNILEMLQNNQKGKYELETDEAYAEINNNVLTYDNMIYIVDKMADVIIRNEVAFCELDSHAGDGDFGLSVAKGFRKLKDEWHGILTVSNGISSFLNYCSLTIMEACGGASGPIWGSAFRAASKSTVNKKQLSTNDVGEMLQAAVEGIQTTGERSFGRGAVVGDKTLIDALVPYADTWTKNANQGNDIKEISKLSVNAAVEGAEKTKEMVARMGRAGTVGERSLGHPDAGAKGLSIILSEIHKCLNYN